MSNDQRKQPFQCASCGRVVQNGSVMDFTQKMCVHCRVTQGSEAKKK